MKYGYMRVSTTDKQEFTRQEFVLRDYNLDQVFEEKISGTKKASGREAFGELLEVWQKGDEVYFENMSRMARSMQDLIDTTNHLVKVKKVKVVFIKENLTSSGDGLDAMASLVFNIMGAFAQFERDLISDRTKQALKAKAEQGVILGAPRQYDEDIEDKVMSMRSAGHSLGKIATELSIPKSTVARICKRGE
jgi:DNA invertase Pin-like site-specific DNA recombinase